MTGTHVPSRRPRLEFAFLDGLRGLAALFVAVHHTYLFTGTTQDHEALPAVFEPLRYGQYAVTVFIVLSGFVLGLPLAPDRPALTRGWATFLKRRARRILPPYYAALAFFLLLIALVPPLRQVSGTAWDSKVPVTATGVVSHLLMLHNLGGDWKWQIDGPMWSVATEWQLYLVMPLVLLPVWRRFGAVAMVLLAVAAGWGIHVLFPRFDGAHFWFVADFAFGLVAARHVARARAVPRAGLLAVVAVVVVAVLFLLVPGHGLRDLWFTEVVVGAAVALVLLALAQQSVAGTRTPVHAVLQWRPLVWIGFWSYSLYLLHSPLLGLGNLLTLDRPWGVGARFAVMLLVVLPLALAVSYGFHRLVERRFTTAHQARLRQGAPAAAVDVSETRSSLPS